jgi:ABC-type antimicrobial peptide transport system permease subunit
LIRQLLTESLLLAATGGIAGLYVAYLGTHALLLLAFRGAHYIPISPRPSVPVLVFATLLSLATGIVFGIAPAWMASRSHPTDALRSAGRASGRRTSRIQKSLIVVQVALSIVLLVGAGSLTASLRNLGTAVAIACARTVRTLLYGINPIDPLTLIIAIVGLLTIALAASLLPAIRAASVDPIQALREE